MTSDADVARGSGQEGVSGVGSREMLLGRGAGRSTLSRYFQRKEASDLHVGLLGSGQLYSCTNVRVLEERVTWEVTGQRGKGFSEGHPSPSHLQGGES